MRALLFLLQADAIATQSSIANTLGYPENLTSKYADIFQNSAYPLNYILRIAPCYSPDNNRVMDVENEILTPVQKLLVQNITLNNDSP